MNRSRLLTQLIMIAILLAVTAKAQAVEAAAVPEPQAKDMNGESSPVVKSIDVKPGDRWTYQTYDEITGELKYTQTLTVTELRGNTYSVNVATSNPNAAFASSTILAVYDADWNLLDDGVWRRTGNGDQSTGIKLPLKVGASWKTKFIASKQNPDVSFNWSTSSNVVAYEDVATRSGTHYHGFRIETTMTSISGNNRKIVAKSTRWYVPEINRYVKKVAEGTNNGRLAWKTTEYLTFHGRRSDE